MDIHSALKLLRINLKHNFIPHAVIAVIVAVFTPLIITINSLDEKMAARPLEMMLSIVGIILLTPIFMPEQNENIRDVIRSKKTDHTRVCILRIFYSVAALAILIGVFTIVMSFSGSCVTLRHFVGGFATAFFLGAIGILIAGISGNTTSAYMVSLIYYIANFTLKDKLGYFYLFSMCSGSFKEKYCLIFSAAVMTIAGVAFNRLRK